MGTGILAEFSGKSRVAAQFYDPLTQVIQGASGTFTARISGTPNNLACAPMDRLCP